MQSRYWFHLGIQELRTPPGDGTRLRPRLQDHLMVLDPRSDGGFGRSATSTMITASAIVATYNRRGSLGSEATITGDNLRYRLSS
jgi:hypothetical protein